MPCAIQTEQIVLRDIKEAKEIKAVEDLQIEAWGDEERDIVPLNQLVAASYVGGSLIGAFDENRLVGFAYGFYGHLGGRIVHHSHMLAVAPAYRNHDLGRQLKRAQRERVLADKITDRMTWTFDPLQSPNAHFNFKKLGVLSDTYKINVYGEKGSSFLHRNGTDRLFVTWLLNSPRVEGLIAGESAVRRFSTQTVDRLLRVSNSGDPEPDLTIRDILSASVIAIEIPADINSIERADFAVARKWREETRRAFTMAFSQGFVAVDYFLENERTGYYLLEQRSLDGIGS